MLEVRPWNAGNTKHREKGAYYDKSWDAAMRAGPDFISVTSYNEWMEGKFPLSTILSNSD